MFRFCVSPTLQFSFFQNIPFKFTVFAQFELFWYHNAGFFFAVIMVRTPRKESHGFVILPPLELQFFKSKFSSFFCLLLDTFQYFQVLGIYTLDFIIINCTRFHINYFYFAVINESTSIKQHFGKNLKALVGSL